jgi:hypothetical protein
MPVQEESWCEEIERRVRQIDSGAVRMIPSEQARRRLKSLNR